MCVEAALNELLASKGSLTVGVRHYIKDQPTQSDFDVLALSAIFVNRVN